MDESKQRRWTVAGLALAMLLLLLTLAALNAFNPLPLLQPHDSGQIFFFTAVSSIAFLLLLTLLVLLFRNIVKLLVEHRGRVLGSRIRSRMLFGGMLLSLMPAAFLFLFSFLLLNRSIERWFSQPATQLRQSSASIALELTQYAAANARSEAESLASSPRLIRALQMHDRARLAQELGTHRITLQGGFAVVYRDREPVEEYQMPSPGGQPPAIRRWLAVDPGDRESPFSSSQPIADIVLQTAQRSDQPILDVGRSDYLLGAAGTADGGMVVVGLPLPAGLSETVDAIRSGTRDYWILFRARNSIRGTYLLLLFLMTVLTFFASSWLALLFSKQVTRPVEALADAMDAIAAGHYSHRVKVSSHDELAELVRSFNSMAADLEESRRLAETSAVQLSAANRALEERRSELETVLETIPTGVVTLDSEMRVLQANRGSRKLLNSQRPQELSGMPLEALFPGEIADELVLLVRRGQRMGTAAAEIELPGPREALNVTVTVAMLDLGNRRQGCILVMEDVTDILSAQRQLAWKEVARRVAHEIKNPLTPISLSAERIRRHVDHAVAESSGIIRKCSDVILASVETLGSLVDQFAALAQFPASEPKACDVNAIVENARALFADRLHHIRIVERLADGLPPVLADPEAMKRALANLIDNAAEAMQGSLLRELTLETGLIEGRTKVEIVVSDTGHGLNDQMRERLFLPYVSTKQRGTGLGLAIAAKIIREHHGAIRAERNSPAGARFIIELPLAEAGGEGETAASGYGRVSA